MRSAERCLLSATQTLSPLNARGQLSDIDALFEEIRLRLAEQPAGSCSEADLLAHLHSLARWHREPNDYPDPGQVAFPSTIVVAYAVCHPECGVHEFIVEGSTQECQGCGGLLFRTDDRNYVLDAPVP